MNTSDISMYNSHSDALLFIGLLISMIFIAVILVVAWKYRNLPGEVWEFLTK